MTDNELKAMTELYAEEHGITCKIYPIAKPALEKGVEYSGISRNTGTATWNGEQFEYKRLKFGFVFEDVMNHYWDDDGYDVFIPFFVLPKTK